MILGFRITFPHEPDEKPALAPVGLHESFKAMKEAVAEGVYLVLEGRGEPDEALCGLPSEGFGPGVLREVFDESSRRSRKLHKLPVGR